MLTLEDKQLLAEAIAATAVQLQANAGASANAATYGGENGTGSGAH